MITIMILILLFIQENVVHQPVTNRTSSTMSYQIPPSPLSTMYSQDDLSETTSRLNSSRSISTLYPQRNGSVTGFINEEPVDIESPPLNILLNQQGNPREESFRASLSSSPLDSSPLPTLSQQNSAFQTPAANTPWPGIWKLLSVVYNKN